MSQAKEKIRQVFRFLAELQKNRTPPVRQIDQYDWHLYFAKLPKNASIEMDPGIRGGATQADAPLSEQGFILRVRRPQETACPPPPEILRDWVLPGWQKIDGTEERIETRNRTFDGSVITEPFEKDPGRVAAWGAWREKRKTWVEAERPVRQALAVFQKLFELRGRLQREAEKYQLVLGDGLLKVKDTEGFIDHPLLLQKVDLQFDPDVPEFRIVETDDVCELYTSLLESIPSVDGKQLGRCRTELAPGHYHPLGREDTDGFLTRLVQSVFANGRLVPPEALASPLDMPVVYRNPVVYLAPRSAGFTNAIEAILRRLEKSDDFSPVLSRVVGIDPTETNENMPGNGATRSLLRASRTNSDVDLLLTKPANPEQERVIQKLANTGSVLVQGPPGTGKTHTIANLVGHLLAQGKSILVTSHTAKALRIVRESIAEELRPLCVSVLDTDLSSRNELEEAVTGISRRLSINDPDQLEQKATELQRERQALKAQIEEVHRKLDRAIKDEYDSIVVGGVSVQPSEAARRVREGTGKDDWVPGPVRPGVVLPLSTSEIREIYRLNEIIPLEDVRDLGGRLPELDSILSARDFSASAGRIRSLRVMDLRADENIWPIDSECSLRDLDNLYRQLDIALKVFARPDPWFLECVEAGLWRGARQERWEELIGLIEETHLKISQWENLLLRRDVTIKSEMSPGEQKQVCKEIIEHFQAGGKLRRLSLLFRRRWKRLIAATTVDGRRPQLLSDFEVVDAWLSISECREQLHRRWEKQIAHLGAPIGANPGERPEDLCHQFIHQFQVGLAWSERTWTPCAECLQQLGISWELVQRRIPPLAGSCAKIRRLERAIREHLFPMIDHRKLLLEFEGLTRAHTAIVRTLAAFEPEEDPGQVVRRLHEAASALDAESYTPAWTRLEALHRQRKHFVRRSDLFAKLESAAGEWVSALRHRTPPHHTPVAPGDPERAWLYRQLLEEMERRAATDVDKLQCELITLKDHLQQRTREFVDCRTWAAQCKRTSLAQKQALQGWLDLVRKPGFNSGVRSAVLKAEARKKLDQCRTAVPVWIMPLSRAADSYDFESTRFDVVIIDEASQSDVMGLLAFALGREIVVVGDHEQVSPSAVGQNLALVQNLIDQYLQGIPNGELYDGRTSIYDLARQSFGATIRLVEHFRCVPEIIQFSNHLCYHGEVKPLRESSAVQTRPFVVAHRVVDGMAENKVNQMEAEEVASLLIASGDQAEYADKTMGVISMVGEEQAMLIDALLQRHMPEATYAKRRTFCGNSAQFQGDERDVIFLSLVDSSPTGEPLAIRASEDWKRRFNVATSRARDQFWVVHSLNPSTDLKPGDLRLRLIQHAEDPSALTRELTRAIHRAESEFERQVIGRLHEGGYRAHSQWEVGAYRIDIVVVGQDGRKAAVECDGDRYHTPDNLKADMDRQMILERLGWRFVRIRGSRFFRNPNATMTKVYERLGQLGVEPIGPELKLPESLSEATELRQRVLRRAEELRQQWQKTNETAYQAVKPTRSCKPKVKTSALAEKDKPVKDSIPEPGQQGQSLAVSSAG